MSSRSNECRLSSAPTPRMNENCTSIPNKNPLLSVRWTQQKKTSCAFTWDAMLSRESPLNRKPIATDGGTGCFRVVTKRYIVVQITNPVYSFLSKNYYCKESKETPYTVHNRLINLEYQTVVITDKFSSGGDCNSYKEDDYSATMKVNAF